MREPSETPKVIEHNVGILSVGDFDGSTVEKSLELYEQVPAGERPKALVIIGEVTGATPKALNPHFQKLASEGTDIFVIANNDHGIDRLKYGSQQEAAQAGVIHLQRTNVREVTQIAQEIQRAIDSGKSGPALKREVSQKYGSSTATPTTK